MCKPGGGEGGACCGGTADHYHQPGVMNGLNASAFLWTIRREVILLLTDRESCVIAGRCADYIRSAAGLERCVDVQEALYRGGRCWVKLKNTGQKAAGGVFFPWTFMYL